MRKRPSLQAGVILIIGLASPACSRAKEKSVFDRFSSMHSMSYSIESRNPLVLKWKGKIAIPYGKTAELEASSFSTIWKSIKYSDESQARTILDGYMVDYCLLDIRHDPKADQLLLLTSGSIWSEDFRNHYLFCYDLRQRKVLAQTLVPPAVFDNIHAPEPELPNQPMHSDGAAIAAPPVMAGR